MCNIARSNRRRPVPRAVTSPDKTSIPIIADRWSRYHGTQRVQHGALRGRTWTDYFVFDCPGCNFPFHCGAGIRLIGVSDPIDKPAPGDIQVLVFRIECPNCRFKDCFKMEFDQGGTFKPQPRRRGRPPKPPMRPRVPWL